MFEGYLQLGGNEIINDARTYGYTRSVDCPIGWLQCGPCDGLIELLEDDPYDIVNIEHAPWYDPRNPATWRFYGAYGLSMENMTDSTRTASVTEGILDGGVVGRVRREVREVRIRAMLIAEGDDALEEGLSWLKAALDPESCGTHGDACGSADVCFYTACPEPRRTGDDPESIEEWEERTDALLRKLHGVTAISGPLVEQKLHRGDVYAYIVEFTLAAATPWVFSDTRPIEITPQTPVVVQDVAFNLAPYPSAEVASGTVTVATNHSPNPSVETNVTGWVTAQDGTAIAPATIAAASRSTELAAVGTASAKTTFTATGASAVAGWFDLVQTVTLPTTVTAGQRYSVNVWSARNIQAGAPVLGDHQVWAFWQDAASTNLRQDLIGTVAGGSGAVSGKSIAPPVGTTKVAVRVRTWVTSWNAGTIVRLYADALAVTVP